MKWALLLVLGLAISARAELKEIASSLTLDQVVADALRDNPQLHAMRAKWEALQERPAQERTPANPLLQYSAMDGIDGGNWPNTGEKRVMIEQEFPWFGKLGLKGKIAGQDAVAMQRDYETLQRDIVMLVKETYFDLYGTQQAIVFTRSEADVLDRLVRITETMYSTGARAQQDVLKAQAEITMLKQKGLELETQEATLKAKLNNLLNRRPDAPLGLALTAPANELAATAAQLLGLAEKSRPEIKKAQAEIQRDQYQRELMKKEGLPNYRLGLEYRNVGVDYSNFSRMDNMLMVIVGVDLPIWHSKTHAGVREADKMIESSQATLEAVVQQASFEVQDAWFKLQTARRTLALYQKELIPQAEARFAASEAGYRTGKTDFADLLESERFQLNARMMAALAEGNLGSQLARLERAVGTDLKSSPPPEETK